MNMNFLIHRILKVAIIVGFSVPVFAALDGDKHGCYALCKTVKIVPMEKYGSNYFGVEYGAVAVASVGKTDKGEALLDLIAQCDQISAENFSAIMESQAEVGLVNFQLIQTKDWARGLHRFDDFGNLEEFRAKYHLRLISDSQNGQIVDFVPANACM